MERKSDLYESPEQLQEKIITQVISHVTSKIYEAAKLYEERKKNGDVTDIVEYLQKVWPENDGVPWQRRPRFIVPGLQESVEIRFESQITEYDTTSRTMSLAIGSLRDASTPQEFQQALVRLTQSVYHESEHIYNPGVEFDNEDGVKGIIEYLCNEGEILAHAREFSYRYKKEFPNQTFDLELMKELAAKLKDEEGNNNAYYYFTLFLDPTRQDKYRLYGDVLKVHQKICEIMGRLVK